METNVNITRTLLLALLLSACQPTETESKTTEPEHSVSKIEQDQN